MKPTIGRIVHYQAYGTPGGEFKPEPRAAMLDESAQPKGGTWHWPPREPTP